MSDGTRFAALEKRIDELESRAAIADVIHRYAEAIRGRAPERVLELMEPDVVVELHHADPDDLGQTELMSRYRGHDEVRGSFAEQAGSAARVWPMLHNLRIELDGDEARATCVIASQVWPHGMQYVGEYRDRFRRRDGAWRFAARVHVGYGAADGQYSREANQAYQATKT
ncbi:MAG: nuclear transport factor 2 family protein [Novosphingobium sp.]